MPVFRSRVLVGRWWQVAPRVLGVALMAGILWWGIEKHWDEVVLLRVWGTPFLTWNSGSPLSIGEWFWAALEWIAFVVAAIAGMAFVWVAVTERMSVDDEGLALQLSLPAFTLFRLPWKRIIRFDHIQHGRELATLVIHFRLWNRVPAAFAIHPGRYQDSQLFPELVLGQLRKQGTPTRWIVVGVIARRLGLALVALGLVPMVAFWLLVRHGLNIWLNPESPVTAIAALPSPSVLTILYLATVALCSFGFGCLSAYHRGDVRFFLLLIWVVFVSGASPVLIYQLTIIAIWAIVLAQMTPLTLGGENPSLLPPTAWHLSLAPLAGILAPLLALAAYLIGVALFRRPGPAWDYTKAGETEAGSG